MPYTGNLVRQATIPRIDQSSPIDPVHASDQWWETPWSPQPAPPMPGTDAVTVGGGFTQGPEAVPHTVGAMLADPTHTAGDGPTAYDNELEWDRQSAHVHDQVTFEPLRYPILPAQGTGYSVTTREGMSGWTPPTEVLLGGRNASSQQNPDTELYGPSGFRPGSDTVTLGQYASPANPWASYDLRAVERETVVMPVDTPVPADPSPWTSPFSGSMWFGGSQPLFNQPMMYAPPSTTSISDQILAAETSGAGTFTDDGGML